MQIPKERFALTLCALLSCCAPLLLEAAPLSPPQTAAATTILGLSERPVYYKRFVRRRPSPHDKVLDVYEVREVYYVRRTTVKPPRQLSNEEIDRRILCDFNPTVPECAETLRGATPSSTTEPSTTTTTTTAATTTKATTTKATRTKATTTKATTTTSDLPFLPILPEATTEDDYMLPEEDDEEDLDDTVDGIKPYTNYDNDERTEYEAPEEQQEDQEDEEEEEQEVEKKQEEDENDYMDHINHGSIGGLDMS